MFSFGLFIKLFGRQFLEIYIVLLLLFIIDFGLDVLEEDDMFIVIFGYFVYDVIILVFGFY